MPAMLRIRELREAAGLTQEGLAREADVSLGTVQRAERLDTASTDTLRKLAAALEVQVGDLFGEVPA